MKVATSNTFIFTNRNNFFISKNRNYHQERPADVYSMNCVSQLYC